jgi:hypothetical protein
MCESGVAFWRLLVKEKKTNGIMPEIRYSILRWWAQETRVSPNKSEVAIKRLELGIYNKKPIRFIIETQVCL